MLKHKFKFRFATGLAAVAATLLLWLSMGVGINGADGDPFERIYLVVIAIGLIGSILSRLRPIGMARVLVAMAIAQMIIAAIAITLGKHHSPVSSLLEILILNTGFATLFLGSAWLFRESSH